MLENRKCVTENQKIAELEKSTHEIGIQTRAIANQFNHANEMIRKIMDSNSCYLTSPLPQIRTII